MSSYLRILLIFALLAGFSGVPDLAYAQANPFSRKVPEPEPEPEPVQVSTQPAVLPPSSAQPSVLDYGLEFEAFDLVALRDGVAAVRTPETIYFLKDGEEFNFNGAVYNVSVSGSVLKLTIEGLDEEDQDLVVLERRVGRRLNLTSSF